MKILFDENMPYAASLFSRLGAAQGISARKIPHDLLMNAKALLVRSITQVNAALLSRSNVNFVGTATSGTDHVDQVWLQKQGIVFSSAPGCNAISVVEYVFSALLVLSERDGFQLRDKSIGIVGVGNIGSCLNARLKALGVRTLLCDPPRAKRGDKEEFWPLEKLVAEADVLTFHIPLNKSGKYASLHLVDEDLLASLPDNRILLNTCRGPVVDSTALLKALAKGKKLRTVLDVWDPEPDFSTALLERVDIGTAHIAGYSLEGKARGTIAVFEAYGHYIEHPQKIALTSLLPIAEFSHIQLNGRLDQEKLKRLIHLVYDVRRDDALMRGIVNTSSEFDRLRKYYQDRREWSSLRVQCDNSSSAEVLLNLGFNVL